MRRIWTVARRELKALFDHPTGYVLLVAFLAINNFIFFRQAYFSGVASLRPMLDLLPWELLLFVAAVTMRALAEDTRSGQLEVLLAQPITELELLIGKYLGSVLFLWIALALTLPIPLGMTFGAELSWGPVVAQYVGAALLMAGLAGVGVWASSLTRSQITAFITTIAVIFVLILVGLDPLIVGLPATLGAIAARLGVLSHFQNIARGVIDLRDAIYFVSLAGLFIALAYGALLGRKLARGGGAARRLRLGVGVLAATVVVVNLLGNYIGGRLDLTPGNVYTLSPASRDMVGSLDDLVTVKLFASEELPTEVALMKRDVDDLLRDLRAAGDGKVRIIERDPVQDESAQKDAETLGIRPVQFNVVGEGELQVKQGYFGLSVQYAEETETIPFIDRTDNLEYRLVSSIRSITRTERPVVGVVQEASAGMRFGAFQEQLRRNYDVRTVSLADANQPAEDIATLVLLGAPDSLPFGARERMDAFFDRGGSALVLAPGMQLSPQMPFATPRPLVWNEVLDRFGVSIRSDLAFDLMANEMVPLPTPFGQVLQPYPLFVRSRGTGASAINQDVSDVTLTWTSTVDTAGATAPVTPLLLSTEAAGTLTGSTSIEPTQQFPDTSLAPRLLAVAVGGEGGDTASAGRAVIVGSADFASDRFVNYAPDNLAFALNAVDWLAQDVSLISIRSKDRRPPPLVFESATEQESVKYANVIGIPLLIVAVGAFRLVRRRRKTRERYQPLVVAPGEAV